MCAVECLDGTLLVPAGTPVTPMVLERIKNFKDLVGIREPIRIEDLAGGHAAAA